MMLRYVEVALSPYEVPGEQSICIYISGCRNNCKGCHYPELQSPENGDLLVNYFTAIIELYLKRATCVCFLGEGDGSCSARNELRLHAEQAQQLGLKTCLYSGRDVPLEEWMHCFDYVKLGSYKEDLGPLDSQTTNQKLFKKTDSTHEDITHIFRL